MRHSLPARSAVLVLLLLTATGVALAPLPTGAPPASNPDSITGYVVPRMVALNETITSVRGMIEERSRNIVALRANADRIDRLVAEIDRWISESGEAHLVADAVREYELGRDTVREAIDDARTALATFDFSGMAALVGQFDRGSGHLETALALFQHGG